MVAKVRQGASMRSVAREYRVSLCTVRWWVRRAGDAPLEQVDWTNRPPLAKRVRRTHAAVEDLVLTVRERLKEHSDLGEFGAKAIHRELVAQEYPVVPAVRTIGRILGRRGVLDGHARLRRTPPPRGWYLPDVASRQAELDSFDIIEGLALRGGWQLEVLTGISVLGGLPCAWPLDLVSAKLAVECLLEHWQAFGLPTYAQFDNDSIFQGGHHGRDILSRVVRTCLQLRITPVFAPPQEPGFQAAIESFNGRWQVKVWARFYHDSLEALQERSRRYLIALRQRSAERIQSAPERRPFLSPWRPDLQAQPRGRIIFIRRTSEQGAVSVLGHTFSVDPSWSYRLVRCEVDLDAEAIRFYALRRRAPVHQPLLRQVPYTRPHRPFHE